MIALIRTFIASNWVKLLNYAAIAVAALTVYLKIRAGGANAEKAKAAEKTQQLVEKSNETENTIRRLPVGAASKQLFNKWARK